MLKCFFEKMMHNEKHNDLDLKFQVTSINSRSWEGEGKCVLKCSLSQGKVNRNCLTIQVHSEIYLQVSLM